MTPLALVPLLVPVAIAVVNAIAWLLFGQVVIGPWFDEQYSGKTPWWKRLTSYPLRWARAKVTAITERIKAEMSYRFLATSPAASRWLHRQARTLESLSGVIVAEAQATHKALHTLRHTTIPTLLAAKVEPIWERIERLSDRLGVTEGRVQDAGQLITGTLARLPWGAPAGFVPALDSWLGSYRHLWEQVFEHVQPRLNRLVFETVPELASRVTALGNQVEALARAVPDNFAARWSVVEDKVLRVFPERFDALQLAINTLAGEIFGEAGEGLAALATRIIALEQAAEAELRPRLDALEQGLAELRTEIEQGIRTGLEAFGARVEALEEAVASALPTQLAALQLAVDTLAAEIFEGAGEGLAALTARILEVERRLADLVVPQLDLALGRIEDLEFRITNDLLPRLRSIEDLLVPAAFAALVLATMRQVAPNLFCRNVTSTASRVCAQDEGLWASLLAGTLVFAIALNPREIAAAGAALTGILGGVIAETVDH